jgi:hypothetical protein
MKNSVCLRGLIALALICVPGLGQESEPEGVATPGSGSHGSVAVPSRSLVLAGPCEKVAEPSRQSILDESREKMMKFLIAVQAMTVRYEAVRSSRAMQEIPVVEGKFAPYVKEFLKSHDSYRRSHASNQGGPGDLEAFIPPAVLGLFAILSTTDSPTTGPTSRWEKRMGYSSFAVSALSTTFLMTGRSLGVEALRSTAGDLTVLQEKVLQDTLNQQIADPAVVLGNALNWNTQQKTRFSQALRRKTVDTMVTYVAGIEPVPGPSPKSVLPIQPTLAAKLSEIDFLALIEEQTLASPSELSALRSIQKTQEMAAGLRKELLSASGAKALLAEGPGISENLHQLATLHRLMQKVSAGLSPGPSKDEAEKLAAEVKRSMEVIQHLCEVAEL